MAEPAKTAGSAKTAETMKEPTIKSKGIAALVSLIFPGIGLVLCRPSRMAEGVIVFAIAALADLATITLSLGGVFVGGPVLGGLLTAITGGLCCIAVPIISFISFFGLLLLPLVHILGAIHTYMRG